MRKILLSLCDSSRSPLLACFLALKVRFKFTLLAFFLNVLIILISHTIIAKFSTCILFRSQNISSSRVIILILLYLILSLFNLNFLLIISCILNWIFSIKFTIQPILFFVCTIKCSV